MKKALLKSCTSSLVLLALTLPSAADVNQAVLQAEKAVIWAKTFPCPQPRQMISIRGLESDQAVLAKKKTAEDYGNQSRTLLGSAIQKRQAVLAKIRTYKHKPSKKLTTQLAALDKAIGDRVANVGAQLTQWLLAEWVAMSRVDVTYAPKITQAKSVPRERTSSRRSRSRSDVAKSEKSNTAVRPDSSHPLSAFLVGYTDLIKFTKQFETLPGYDAYIKPLPNKHYQCLAQMQAAIFSYNGNLIRNVVENATDSHKAKSALSSYVVVGNSLSTAGNEEPSLWAEMNVIINDLESGERQRALEEKRKREIVANKRRAEEKKQRTAEHAKRKAAAKKNLALARIYVDAINSKSVSQARSVMHLDIYISSPNGSTRGIDAGVRRLREGFSSDNGGSLDAPRMSNSLSISATVYTNRGRGTMSFGFRDGKIISVNVRR